MHSAEISAADSAAGVSVPSWRVLEVRALPGFRLALRFADGTRGEVGLHRLIHSDDAGVFASLREPRLFEAAHVDHGAVTWSGAIDLAPDALYTAVSQGRTELV